MLLGLAWIAQCGYHPTREGLQSQPVWHLPRIDSTLLKPVPTTIVHHPPVASRVEDDEFGSFAVADEHDEDGSCDAISLVLPTVAAPSTGVADVADIAPQVQPAFIASSIAFDSQSIKPVQQSTATQHPSQEDFGDFSFSVSDAPLATEPSVTLASLDQPAKPLGSIQFQGPIHSTQDDFGDFAAPTGTEVSVVFSTEFLSRALSHVGFDGGVERESSLVVQPIVNNDGCVERESTVVVQPMVKETSAVFDPYEALRGLSFDVTSCVSMPSLDAGLIQPVEPDVPHLSSQAVLAQPTKEDTSLLGLVAPPFEHPFEHLIETVTAPSTVGLGSQNLNLDSDDFGDFALAEPTQDMTHTISDQGLLFPAALAMPDLIDQSSQQPLETPSTSFVAQPSVSMNTSIPTEQQVSQTFNADPALETDDFGDFALAVETEKTPLEPSISLIDAAPANQPLLTSTAPSLLPDLVSATPVVTSPTIPFAADLLDFLGPSSLSSSAPVVCHSAFAFDNWSSLETPSSVEAPRQSVDEALFDFDPLTPRFDRMTTEADVPKFSWSEGASHTPNYNAIAELDGRSNTSHITTWYILFDRSNLDKIFVIT